MTDIMKLATDYAQACYNLANPDSYDAELADEARAALQSAIEALQSECAEHKENAMRNARIAVSIRAERDQLQSKLGDAIQSSAHWQHQFTEAQAENDLLKGYRDRALELATAYNNAQENIEQISAHRQHILAVNEKLTAQVDAMSKGEPVAWQFRTNGKHWHVVQVCPPDDAYDKGTLSPLYAAPKALAPLERVAECAARLVEHADFQLGGILSADSKAKDIPSKAVSQVKSRHLAALRDSLAAHGIGGTP